LLGLFTGSRSGVLLNLRWDQIDLMRGVMLRRAYGQAEINNKRAPPVRLGRRAVLFLRRWKALDGMRVHLNGQKIKKLVEVSPQPAPLVASKLHRTLCGTRAQLG
jgi:integrase